MINSCPLVASIDIAYLILAHVQDGESYKQAKLVCKFWHQIFNKESFWKEVCHYKWDPHYKPRDRSWKYHFGIRFSYEKGIGTGKSYQNLIKHKNADGNKRVPLIEQIRLEDQDIHQICHIENIKSCLYLAKQNLNAPLDSSLTIQSLPLTADFTCIHLSSSYLVVGLSTGDIKIFDSLSLNIVKTIESAHNGIKIIRVFVYENQILLSLDEQGQVKVWEISTGACQKTIQTHLQDINYLSQTGDYLILRSVHRQTRGLWIYNLKENGVLFKLDSLQFAGWVWNYRVACDAQKIAVIVQDKIKIWSLAGKKWNLVVSINSDICPYSNSGQLRFRIHEMIIHQSLLATTHKSHDYQSNSYKTIVKFWNLLNGHYLFEKTCDFWVDHLTAHDNKIMAWSNDKIKVWHFHPLDSNQNN